MAAGMVCAIRSYFAPPGLPATLLECALTRATVDLTVLLASPDPTNLINTGAVPGRLCKECVPIHRRQEAQDPLHG